MRNFLLSTVTAGACILLCAQASAQVKGNPVLQTPPRPVFVQKENGSISPELQQLFDNKTGTRKKQPSGKTPVPGNAMEKYLQLNGDQVLVDITVRDNMAAAKRSLQQLGLQITGVYGRIISGIMPISALPQLSAVKTIQYAKPAYKPMHQGIITKSFLQSCNENAFFSKPVPVVTQGDTAQRSVLARQQYKVSGKGVKVGILSDSYNNLGSAPTGVVNGELPGPGNPFNLKKPVDVLQDLDNGRGTDEGRAMAEIIHDVAPGAELAFHTAFLGTANFAQGIQDLVAKGCKVITDDVFYYDEPFFQDGIIAQSVDLARKKGVSFFSAAGNNFNNSYESDYRASAEELIGVGNGTAHNFSAPGDLPRYYQPVFIPSGGSFIASFQWDQPFFSAGGQGASSDLDIYLIDINGNIVSAGTSNNIVSGDPVEVFGFDNFTPDYTFFIVIVKKAGPDPLKLKYNMYANAQFYTTTPVIPGLFAATLVGHAKAEGAIATAATPFYQTPAYGSDTAKAEWFSSLGGVPNYFDVAGNRIAAVIRKKPDITAPDGGNTSFFDPFGNGDIIQDTDVFPNFFGTSAAAPHAAGVAALMIEAEKLNNLTPGQVKGVLSASTSDMDDAYLSGFSTGFDFSTGTGLIKADEAVGKVKFPNLYIRDLGLTPLCSDKPSFTRNWKIVNPNPFEVETHWLLLGSNQHGSITAAPGETVFTSNTISLGSFQVPNILLLDWDDNYGFTRLAIVSSSRATCGNNAASRMMAAEVSPEDLGKPMMIADVFPNPATTTFRVYLALADQQPVNMQLFSIDGRKIFDKRVSQSKGIVPIDATAYKPGVYMLTIRQGAFSKTIKLIKQ